MALPPPFRMDARPSNPPVTPSARRWPASKPLDSRTPSLHKGLMTAIQTSTKPKGESLVYPFPTVPAAGETIEVAPGILWVRMPLPFRLNHVNLYLIEDGDGYAVLDAGI